MVDETELDEPKVDKTVVDEIAVDEPGPHHYYGSLVCIGWGHRKKIPYYHKQTSIFGHVPIIWVILQDLEKCTIKKRNCKSVYF